VDYYEQRGYGPAPCSRSPRPVTTDLRFASITAASGFTCALTREGVAYCWGHWGNRRFGGAAAPVGGVGGDGIARIEATVPFTQISADGGRACALTSDGRIACWGGGSATRPVPVAADVRFASVSRGWRHTCGVTAEGEAYCWGENETGQLGTGVVNARFDSGDSSVHRVAGGVLFRTIDAGFLSTCGTTEDGTQYCWGDGGVIGAAVRDRCAHADVSSSCALTPARTPLSDVVATTSGFTHRCALLANGRIFCWGYNESHAVSSDTARHVPAPALVVR
jgi:alpha-tubulin suppressor-like RCC1 family protein